MASNSTTLVKCSPKNTGLLLSEIFKDPPIVPCKQGRLVRTKLSKWLLRLDIGVLHPIFITEEIQRAGTAKMHREAVHSGLLPPLSVHLRKDLAHKIKKWPVSFDLL